MSKSSSQRRQEKKDQEKERKLNAIPFPGASNGSTQALINQYIRSHDYRDLSLDTKRIYYRALIRLGNINPAPAIGLSTIDIHKELCYLSPGMAAQFLSVGSVFYNWLGITNPFEKIKKPKCGEWKAWTIDDVARAAKDHGSQAYKYDWVLFLAAFAGLRVSDIAKIEFPSMDPDDVYDRGLILSYRQKKTGEEMFVPIPGPVFQYYARIWRGGDDEDAREFVKNMVHFINIYGWEDGASVDYIARSLASSVGKPFHGLRKTCSWLLAEGECSAHEIAAVTGHRTMTMLARYTRMAEKKRLAQSAMLKLTRRLNEAGQGDTARVR